MFFCPNCNNAYDIARTVTDIQSGGKNTSSESSSQNYEDIVNKIIAGDDTISDDVNDLDITLFLKSIAYKKLSSKKKELVYNKIQDKLPESKKLLIQNKTTEANESNAAFFVCKNCIYNVPIKDSTLIFSKSSSDITRSYTSTTDANKIYSEILPLTRKYICPNTKCESHKDLTKREAIIYRIHNSFGVKYKCTSCLQEWLP